jgi:hypothetical protein
LRVLSAHRKANDFLVMDKKKSFILYSDFKDKINKLSNEQAGILLKSLFEYTCGEVPVINDLLVDYAFTDIKTVLDRDNMKYINKCNKNQEIAINREAKKREQNNTNVNERTRDNTKSTDNDNVNDNDIIIKNKQHATVCLASDIWKESVAMKSKVPIDKLHLAMDEFLNHLNTIGETKQTLKDFKYHFASWVLKIKNLKN